MINVKIRINSGLKFEIYNSIIDIVSLDLRVTVINSLGVVSIYHRIKNHTIENTRIEIYKSAYGK
jgi:hypothetical protein